MNPSNLESITRWALHIEETPSLSELLESELGYTYMRTKVLSYYIDNDGCLLLLQHRHRHCLRLSSSLSPPTQAINRLCHDEDRPSPLHMPSLSHEHTEHKRKRKLRTKLCPVRLGTSTTPCRTTNKILPCLVTPPNSRPDPRRGSTNRRPQTKH